MGREMEWKYRCPDECFTAIGETFSGWKTIAMETAYLDTQSGALGQRKWMLRRRLENGIPVITMKIPLSDGSRGEWETTDSLPKAIHTLWELGAPSELVSLTEEGLVETCGARFTRLAATVTLPQCTVELALDRGCFFAGDREEPFSELEIELKGGREAEAAAFAQNLARQYRLEPEHKSKAQRARALAGQKPESN